MATLATFAASKRNKVTERTDGKGVSGTRGNINYGYTFQRFYASRGVYAAPVAMPKLAMAAPPPAPNSASGREGKRVSTACRDTFDAHSCKTVDETWDGVG